MPKDLRTWLKDLADRVPGEPLRVTKAVTPSSFEVASILQQLEEKGNLSAVLFEKVTSIKGKPTDFRLLSHTFTTREKMAVSLGAECYKPGGPFREDPGSFQAKEEGADDFPRGSPREGDRHP